MHLKQLCGTKSVNVSYSCLLSDFCLTHTLGDRASEATMQTQTNVKGTTKLQGKPSCWRFSEERFFECSLYYFYFCNFLKVRNYFQISFEKLKIYIYIKSVTCR